MRNLRIGAYLVSFIAILFYFLFPQPEIAVPGALIIQTVAFITIGGRSLVDALLLVGISLILIGYLPPDHTLISGSRYFEQVRWPLLLSGAGLAVTMLTIIIYRIRKKINLTNKVFHPRPK
jgi:hypothetical protein